MAPAPLPTENLDAYNYYLRAEQRTCRAAPASAADAFYEEAIALAPEFAHGCGGFARVATDVPAYGRERRASTPAGPKYDLSDLRPPGLIVPEVCRQYPERCVSMPAEFSSEAPK